MHLILISGSDHEFALAVYGSVNNEYRMLGHVAAEHAQLITTFMGKGKSANCTLLFCKRPYTSTLLCINASLTVIQGIIISSFAAVHNYDNLTAKLPQNARARFSPRAGGTEIQLRIILRSNEETLKNIKSTYEQYDF